MQVIAYLLNENRANSVCVYKDDTSAGKQLKEDCQRITLTGSLESKGDIDELMNSLTALRQWLPNEKKEVPKGWKAKFR